MKFDRKARKLLLYVVLPVYVLLLVVFAYVSSVYRGRYELPATADSPEFEAFLAADYILVDSVVLTVAGDEVHKEAGTLVSREMLVAMMAMRDAKTFGESVEVRGEGPVIGFQYTFVFIVLNFAILVIFLYGLMWKPILNVLDKRKETIADDLTTSRHRRREAEALFEKYRKTMEGARDERESIIADGHRQGDEERQRIVDEAKAEAKTTLERAALAIEGRREQLRRELAGEIGGFSVELAGKILGREVKNEDHSALVEEFLAKIGPTE